MEVGQCIGCGAEDIEINEDGYCVDCANLEGDEKNGEEPEGEADEESV